MSNFRSITLLIITLTIMPILMVLFVHYLKQEKVGDTQKHLPELISQSKFKPPSTSKPKGSSGAGSRRISNNDRYKDKSS